MRQIGVIAVSLLCLTACHQPFQPTTTDPALVILEDDQLYQVDAFDRQQILEHSSERLVFRAERDSFRVNDCLYSLSVTVTAEAAKVMHKTQVVIRAKDEGTNGEWLMVGGSVVFQDAMDSYWDCDHCGTIAVAHPTPEGKRYAAVITPGRSLQRIMDGRFISVQPHPLGDTITYYFGASSADLYPTDEAWFEAVTNAEL
jgi:hypothetical protein